MHFSFSAVDCANYFEPRIWASTRHALSAGMAREASKIENLKLSAMELIQGYGAYARVTQCSIMVP